MRMTLFLYALLISVQTTGAADEMFDGRHYRGRGDGEYLEMLEVSRRMFEPDPRYMNLAMLYEPKWNGLVEGPTWNAWWIQNSYGTTYAALPFLQEPFVTFLKNSQDLWFDQMGDGKRKGMHDWVGPDGCLCDCASPGQIYYRQGDGKIHIHDWGMEFTAAGLVMQAEMLLISRDQKQIAHYLPMLERCVNFIESRRDPKNNLLLAGPAGNLLAPSYAGYKKPDGTYDKAYLTGLSVTYIAALDRMIEVEKLAQRDEVVNEYIKRRDLAKQGLAQLTTEEGYFIRSLDPDGTKHGVYGAAKHRYFESSPNHDAIAFRVVDDEQARKIYNKIASIPQLRPHAFILPNYPSYDDMYEEPKGLWEFGRWVNGGHWSTCEGRMLLVYARLGKFDDIRASMRQLMKFANSFRMDNPLTEQGNNVYQPNEPINICYDTFAPPAAMIRGLFEYLYKADSLTLVPHVPDSITELHQLDPIRFGRSQIYISIAGSGPISSVMLNDQPHSAFTANDVTLPASGFGKIVRLAISRGNAKTPVVSVPAGRVIEDYRQAHVQLAKRARAVIEERRAALERGEIKKLPEPSQHAADRLYEETAKKLAAGLSRGTGF